MKKALAAICVATLLALSAQPAKAGIVLSLTPSAQAVQLGAPVDVALTVSGLSGAPGSSVGSFDLNLSFDASRLGFVSAVFGDPSLGDQLDLFGLGALSGVGTSVGVVNIFEISLDSIVDLDNLQADQFTLATLHFDTLAFGSSALSISLNALGDSSGNALGAEVRDANVTIPEPSSLALALAALLGILGASRRERQVTAA